MRIIATNKKAENLYEIEERIETGISLNGDEVKSLREGRVSLQEGFARIKNNELYLCNVHIAGYKNSSLTNYDPKRDRKLLAHKNEIKRLSGKIQQKGFTLIPLKMYFKENKWVKVELGVCRGKSKYDKREDIKEREHRIAMERALKKHRLKFR